MPDIVCIRTDDRTRSQLPDGSPLAYIENHAPAQRSFPHFSFPFSLHTTPLGQPYKFPQRIGQDVSDFDPHYGDVWD